jgi:hypothetical protein
MVSLLKGLDIRPIKRSQTVGRTPPERWIRHASIDYFSLHQRIVFVVYASRLLSTGTVDLQRLKTHALRSALLLFLNMNGFIETTLAIW